MRTPLLSAIAALVVFAPGAFAHDKNNETDPWYIQYGIGAVIGMPSVDDNPGGSVEWDAGWDITLGLGRDMGKIGKSGKWGWSLEAEGLFSQVEIDSGDLLKVPGANDRKSTTLAWLANAVFDYHFTEQFAWYFGGGIGWASRTKFETWDQGSFNQVDTSGVAYQFKTGIKYNLGGRYDFLFGYRLFATEDLEIENINNGSSFDIENIQHSLEVGVRFGI